jgi:thiol-disulfide isomerase/thioredoxin
MLPLLLAACGRDASPLDAAGPPSQTVDVPDFGLLAYQGEDVLGGRVTHFSNVFAHGKPVVLNFWAGLCPPCRAEMPSFQAVADDYADEVLIIGVDVGPFIGLGSQDDAQQLLHELGVRYPAAAAVDIAPLRLYEVRGMPTTIFFAPNGEIVEKRTGLLLETQLRETIEQLVAPAQ